MNAGTGRRAAFWTIIIIVALLVVARIIAPPIILKKLNAYLEDFSPVYSLHIGDLDLGLIRGAYSFEDLHGKLKANGKEFLAIEDIDVSVAWRELFRGRVLTDIVVDGAAFTLSKELIDSSKSAEAKPKEKAQDAVDTLFPVRIERVVIHHSGINFAQYMGQPEAKLWQISELEGEAVNITSKPKSPFTMFRLNGTVLGSAVLKTVGKLNRLAKPQDWEVDAEVRGFDLVAANPMLMRLVPFTFTSGTLDAYAEAKSENGKINGYVKPFFKKIDVVARKENFVGLKHFAVEVVAAIANLILRKSDDKSTAMRVPFASGPDGIKPDLSRILPTAIQHGFNGGLQPGIEDQVNLERK